MEQTIDDKDYEIKILNENAKLKDEQLAKI